MDFLYITTKSESALTCQLQDFIEILKVVKTMEENKHQNSSVNNELSAAFCNKKPIKEESVTGAGSAVLNAQGWSTLQNKEGK
ncbi:hypothetical protein scyTo_0003179 [Scyliorhinus torazame]|uniref:Uncharacterized protein n=1 Tax=Scyliorhinus torazame TaxID=75743 RepID=A0A401PLT0_SCYTO|nr:hypothetical protein [Scyliorhinus torazame]